MKKISKIVCPIDFSKHSDEVITLAIQTALANEAQLIICHITHQLNIYDLAAPESAMITTYPALLNEIYENELKNSTKNMSKLEEKLNLKYPSLKLTCHIHDAKPYENDIADFIMDYSKKVKANLIVLGSHGRKGIDRLLMGSVAESVMRNSQCGVLIYKTARQKN